MAKIIIFEPLITGHHIEYILHLMNYIVSLNKDTKNKYIFILHPEFISSVERFNITKPDFNDLIIDYINSNYYDKVFKNNNKTGFYQSYSQVSVLKKYIKKHDANNCILMSLDGYFTGLTVNRIKNCKISTIWFHPYVRLPEENVNKRIKKYLKKVVTNIILKTNPIKRIFILNDNFTVRTLNGKNRSVFKMLPDPININFNSKFNDLGLYGQNKKIKFLLFGSISERKGVLVLFETIKNYLSDAILKEIQFCIIGHVSGFFKEKFDKELKRVMEIKPNADIIVEDRYIDYKEIPAIFSKTDFVLVPYINFYGSSGIIGYAAYFKKLLIATNKGLIGELVKEYRLGYSINVTAKHLSEKIKKVIAGGMTINQDALFENYINDHSVQNFVNCLMNE